MKEVVRERQEMRGHSWTLSSRVRRQRLERLWSGGQTMGGRNEQISDQNGMEKPQSEELFGVEWHQTEREGVLMERVSRMR